MSISIESERIILKELKKEDWRAIHTYASQEVACRFQPWGPNSESDSKEFVNQVIEDAQKRPRTRYVFSVNEVSLEKMIGHCELKLEGECAELAYIIHPDYWGKGYVTELARALVRYGFEERKLHRIYATCDARNTGSSRVLEKVGMTWEGKLRQNLLIKDGWRDSLVYGILKGEWK